MGCIIFEKCILFSCSYSMTFKCVIQMYCVLLFTPGTVSENTDEKG